MPQDKPTTIDPQWKVAPHEATPSAPGIVPMRLKPPLKLKPQSEESVYRGKEYPRESQQSFKCMNLYDSVRDVGETLGDFNVRLTMDNTSRGNPFDHHSRGDIIPKRGMCRK